MSLWCDYCDYDMALSQRHICNVQGVGAYDTWAVVIRPNKLGAFTPFTLGVPKGTVNSAAEAREFVFQTHGGLDGKRFY
jgi:hypothetical protein